MSGYHRYYCLTMITGGESYYCVAILTNDSSVKLLWVRHEYDSNIKELADYHDVDIVALAERVKQWSVPQKLAALHTAQAFWNGSKPI